MRQVQVKDVELANIRLRGDTAKLLNSRETQDLAAYFSGYGLGNRLPSLINKELCYEVLIGEETVAAFIVLGKKYVRARIWEGEPADFEWVQNVHKIQRSNDAPAWHEAAVDLVDYFEQIVVAIRREEGVSNKPRPQGGGRPKTTRAEARAMAAELMGVSTDALRKAEDRAKSRERVPTKEDKWELNGYGHSIPADVAHKSKVVHYHLTAVDLLLRKAQTEVTKLVGSVLHPQLQSAIHDDIKGTAETCRYAKPYALCPYCKAVPGPREACGCCLGDGFCTKGVFDGAPAKLRLEPVVVFGGQHVDMASLRVVAGRGLGLDGFGSMVRVTEDTLEVESEPPREWAPDNNDFDVIIED